MIINKFILKFIVIFTSVPVFIVIWELRKVIKTVIDKKPFVDENVKRFRVMGGSFLVFDLFLLIYNIIYSKIVLTSGHIKKDDYLILIIYKLIPGPTSQVAFLISYFLVGCALLIISSIFKQAVIIKNENDITI